MVKFHISPNSANRITWIRAMRRLTGMSLLEAKNAVDAPLLSATTEFLGDLVAEYILCKKDQNSDDAFSLSDIIVGTAKATALWHRPHYRFTSDINASPEAPADYIDDKSIIR